MAKRKTLKRAFEDYQTQEKKRTRQKAHEKRLEEQDKPKAKKLKKAQARSRRINQPFKDGETVLFVGEGNFSFALAFARRFPASAKVSVATSYDKREDAIKKYSDLEGILDQVRQHHRFPAFVLTDEVTQLEEAGMIILFGVDAQVLGQCKDLKKYAKTESDRFHKIVFNFPHVGRSRTCQILFFFF